MFFHFGFCHGFNSIHNDPENVFYPVLFACERGGGNKKKRQQKN